MPDVFSKLFDLSGQVAVITGGSGTLGRVFARGLAGAGAKVAVLGRQKYKTAKVAGELTRQGLQALALTADVLKGKELKAVRDKIIKKWGRIDILVNAAGGNLPQAVLSGQQTFFDLSVQAFEQVHRLNLTGTVLPSLVFAEAMVKNKDKKGCIVNITSMAAFKPLTRVAGYSTAKAAVSNFTQWLAIELAETYGSGMRVNAMAPGFFIGAQNKSLLMNADGSLTPRGKKAIQHTPAGRFGQSHELISTLVWLCGPGASFVNGAVVPVDGGFSAYGGV